MNRTQTNSQDVPLTSVARPGELIGHLSLLFGLRLGAKDYTPEITKVKFRWKMQLNILWELAVKSTGKVTILWKIPLTNEHLLENATDNPR